MQGSPDKNPELYDLSTVAVAVFSDAPETLRQRASLKRAGAADISNLSSEGLKSITQQKIAVIFDQATSEDIITENVRLYENFIDTHPEVSVRFFFLYWRENHTENPHVLNNTHTGERFENVDIDGIATQELPAHINTVLYKARLPLFLRKGYDVEIKTELEDIDGIPYRPIVIRKYSLGEIETAYDYSDCDYMYSDDSDKWILQVTEDGELKTIPRTELPKDARKEGLRIKKTPVATRFYSKKYRKFYRFTRPNKLTETAINDAKPGTVEYVTQGLYIHNKKLYSKTGDTLCEVIGETESVGLKRADSKMCGRMPLNMLKIDEV